MILTLPNRQWLEQFTSRELDPIIDYAIEVADVAFERGHDEFFEDISAWVDMAMDVCCIKILEEDDDGNSTNDN